jgi:hypothetical protein
VSAVIHAVIYGAVFKMTTGETIVVAVVVIAALFMWSRSRDRQGW